MVRTLTLLSVLTLLAGVSVGLFAGQVFGGRHEKERLALDPYVEKQVRAYVERYGLDDARTEQVRAVLVEYRADLDRLYGVLRAKHQDEFRPLAEKANARMKSVLGAR
jgi:hypothetical protein